MKYTSPVYSEARGSIAGLTYSRNKGGLYTRARAIPTNPGTAAQQTVRNNVTELAQLWQSVSSANRNSWASYAANVPVVDKLGASIILTPLNWFIRCNSYRLLAGLTTLQPAPSTYGQLDPETATLTVGTATTSATLTYASGTSQTWNSSGGGLVVFTSRPHPATVTRPPGGYQYAGKVLGTGASLSGTLALTLPFTSGAAGTKLSFYTVALAADGRCSGKFRGSGTAA